MDKRNSLCEHRQPMEQTRSVFCTCDSGVTRCQSQHQCQFWLMSLMLQKSTDLLKDCIENVNTYCKIK